MLVQVAVHRLHDPGPAGCGHALHAGEGRLGLDQHGWEQLTGSGQPGSPQVCYTSHATDSLEAHRCAVSHGQQTVRKPTGVPPLLGSELLGVQVPCVLLLRCFAVSWAVTVPGLQYCEAAMPSPSLQLTARYCGCLCPVAALQTACHLTG